MAARLQEFYRKEIVPQLMKQLGLTNPMAVPRITKITLNMGVGEALADKQGPRERAWAISRRSRARSPCRRKARISVASFKVRDGVAIGCKVTLRNERMYEFLDRLISVAMPRIRDFRGVSRRSFDGQGNYNLGVKEQIIFPEINFDQVDAIRGIDIAITTTARNDDARSRAARGVQVPAAERSLSHGQEIDGDAAEAPREGREAVRRRSAPSSRSSSATRRPGRGQDRGASSSCRSCRATRTRFGCAIAAR